MKLSRRKVQCYSFRVEVLGVNFSMSHKCSTCGCEGKVILAPSIDGEGYEKITKSPRYNNHYRHDFQGWKTSTKARRQWARHIR